MHTGQGGAGGSVGGRIHLSGVGVGHELALRLGLVLGGVKGSRCWR